jgi:hypothetical protein
MIFGLFVTYLKYRGIVITWPWRVPGPQVLQRTGRPVEWPGIFFLSDWHYVQEIRVISAPR